MIRFMIALFILSNLIACGTANNNEVEEPLNNDTNEVSEIENNDTTSEEATNEEMHPDQDFIISQMERLPFTEFELEVKYDNDLEYEVELERKSNGHYKVEFEDDINSIKLKGTEAFEHIFPIISDLTFTKESDKDEIIENVLSVFDLDDHYDTFELEVKFNDGFEVEYKDKK